MSKDSHFIALLVGFSMSAIMIILFMIYMAGGR